MKQYFQQIDVLKGLAMVAVLLLHSLPKTDLLSSGAILHIWQAVPVFMVIMGVNLGLGISGKTQHFNQLYTRSYFQKKGSRILVPFLLIFILSLILGLAWFILYNEDKFTFSFYTFVGVLPISGKGNYFITLLLQSVLFMPIIGYLFSRWPSATLVLLVLLEVVFLLLAKHISFFDEENYLYDAAFPRYFSAIAFGLALAASIKNGFTVSGRVLLVILGLAAAVLLYQLQQTSASLNFIRPEWRLQHVATFAYAGLLVALAMWFLPATSGNFILRFFAALGQASYHIFLCQVLYFGLVEKNGILLYNLAICTVSGYVFYRIEKPFTKLFSNFFSGRSKLNSTNSTT